MKRLHSTVANAGITASDDDNSRNMLQVRATRGAKPQTVLLNPDGSLNLSNLQARFPSAIKLLLTTDNIERLREPENGSFKEPRKGWSHYEVYTVNAEEKLPHVSDLLTRFNVASFNELWTTPQFAPAGIYNKEKFAKYRGRAIQVFLPLILKLGPKGFHLSTLYRMSICDPAICHALLFLVQKHRRCFTCNVKFKNALRALKHFASIYHGQKCLVNFQEPQLIEALLTNARDLGFFSAGDKAPVPLTRDADPSDVDSDTNGTASDDEPPKKRPAALPLPPAISDDDDDSGDRDVYEEPANEDEYPETDGDSDDEDNEDGSIYDEPPAKRRKTSPLSVTANDSEEVSDRDEPSDDSEDAYSVDEEDVDNVADQPTDVDSDGDEHVSADEEPPAKLATPAVSKALEHSLGLLAHKLKRAYQVDMLNQLFKVNSKDELFQLRAFAANRCAIETEFREFRERFYNIIINLKNMDWLSPDSFALDKLLFIRNMLKYRGALSTELDRGIMKCAQCGLEFSTVHYYEHLLTEFHLSDTAFKELAEVMERLLWAGRRKYATFLKPKRVYVGCINQRLGYLKRNWTASQMQLVERDLLCRELMRRGLYHSSCKHISR